MEVVFISGATTDFAFGVFSVFGTGSFECTVEADMLLLKSLLCNP